MVHFSYNNYSIRTFAFPNNLKKYSTRRSIKKDKKQENQCATFEGISYFVVIWTKFAWKLPQ
ncbi:MAG: hypothetical protein A2Z09_00575 [Nitrospirae bacterium RBG_16_43_8]|nr:MAG: hypothetical protein A2Z09_00575 [Nitrospirae bacterium RBG_16_43_8]